MQRVTPNSPSMPVSEDVRARFWEARKKHYAFVNMVRADAVLLRKGHSIAPLATRQHVEGWEYAFDPATMEANGIRPENGATVEIFHCGWVDDAGLTIVKAIVWEPARWK